MGLFSKITDTLFGDPEAGLKEQRKSNEASQQYTKEMAEASVSDANRLYGQSAQPLNQGYQAAIDAIGGTTRQQIDTAARGNYYGQEALLAGMPQFQNAILGMPVDNSAMQPKILHPERNLSWMWNTRLGTRTGGHDPFEGANVEVLKELHDAGLTTQQIRDLHSAKIAGTLPGQTQQAQPAQQNTGQPSQDQLQTMISSPWRF